MPRKKNAFRYSRGLGTIQRVIRGLNFSALQIARALDADLTVMDTEWDKSARRRKNGALHDLVKNFKKATRVNGRFMKKTARMFYKGARK